MNEKLAGLFKCKTRPMTKDESEFLLMVLFAEMQGGDALKDMDKAIREKEVFPHMVMTKRLEVFKEHVSPTLDIGLGPQMFCAMLSDRPGKVVMWAHTLNEMFVKLGRQVMLKDWVEEFPMGVPTEEEYQRVWELQKITPVDRGGDNLIDDFSQWSLPKVEEPAPKTE